MSKVQSLGEAMAEAHGFLGVPTGTFDEGGRRQFIALLREGLAPETKVCEIGSGCLRTAYWLVRFLDADGYCGIEPFRSRVEWGLETLFSKELLAEKAPRFDFNEDFDTSVFQATFDMFLAGSIWTHCSKAHIETMLDGFVDNASPNATFLASYLAATGPEDDYQGDTWVGTSHRSSEAGVIRHSLDWISQQCERRALSVTFVPGAAFDGQNWLRVRRAGVPPHGDMIRD
ncbi:hypothetical protein [Breoghania sp. L-A4]|uniref:hypothetical protein n=1 Tax=Breoghania sp. L-A4 TaxID=2304600 RepID=UPI000E35CD82|nr:hypothetical protein [Breoghania sp. L-A4]AXS41540.1 hypothetical protein D1F64_17920 [Breoghania sp. L-A4]